MRIENSFIPVRGVGEKTERKLWQAGVTHWDEFDPAYVGPTTGDRITSFIREGRDRLAKKDARFFGEQFPNRELWRCYENFRNDTVFFDIETTGLSKTHDDVTTVSVHQGGDTRTLVRGDDLTRENLQRALDGSLLVTFNGSSFDVPFLEQSFDLRLDTPHIDAMHAARRVGLSGGLKSVEQELGIERDRPDISGRDAVRLWHEHERGVDGALETLIAYNREDAMHLRELLDTVTEHLHAETFVT